MMSSIKTTNITWHEGHVTRDERQQLLKQKGVTIWFTGLSGSGKSTLAFTLLEHALVQGFIQMAYVLDGDNIRHGLNKNLGFSAADREENIRRIGEVAKLFADCGIITMTSFISPYRKDRDGVRALHDAGQIPFIEVFLSTPIETCENRDPKGLYKKARAGQPQELHGHRRSVRGSRETRADDRRDLGFSPRRNSSDHGVFAEARTSRLRELRRQVDLRMRARCSEERGEFVPRAAFGNKLTVARPPQ